MEANIILLTVQVKATIILDALLNTPSDPIYKSYFRNFL